MTSCSVNSVPYRSLNLQEPGVETLGIRAEEQQLRAEQGTRVCGVDDPRAHAPPHDLGEKDVTLLDDDGRREVLVREHS
ncbi:hypothetical protein E1281_38530 [Actinomadura sp. KC345]|uniref:hypothetical protein n=1 Tax=Actinomadura sp. KC345 TaxID=2530371 RepID=UPI0010452A1B|nr:hypothetical protein [Actinomadura sp. KC345]TDC39848.1 hypothetical protein E1281_38530 [Actinomadura sp. KC345]